MSLGLDQPASFAEAAPRLRIALRRSTEPEAEAQVVRSPVAPFLDALLVLDHPELLQFVLPSHLDRWGVSQATAFAAGRAALDPSHGLSCSDSRAGLLELASSDGFQASRLLLPGWLAAFRGQVAGEPLAVVPHRRLLLVGGADDPQQVDRLLHIAERGFRLAGGPLSPLPYCSAPDGITPWSPPPGHPVFGRVAHARALLCAAEYDRQRYRLQDHRPPLARATLVRRERASFTWCGWQCGADCWLPETDFVILIDAGQRLLVPWPALLQQVPELLLPTDAWPRRLATRGWPSAQALAALEVVGSVVG